MKRDAGGEPDKISVFGLTFSGFFLRMVGMDSSVPTGLSSAQRRALASVLRSQPSATLGELGSILEGQLGSMLRTLTIGDLLGQPGQSKPGRHPSSLPLAAQKTLVPANEALARAPESVDSRTAAGRRQYDAAVLSALRSAGRPLSAGELRLMVGGSGQQIRVSLKRLVEEDGVERSGIARGTRYHV